MNESIRNISIQKAKDRPNSYLYRLILPSWVIETLGIDMQGYSRGKEINRQVIIREEEGKVIIEKVD